MILLEIILGLMLGLGLFSFILIFIGYVLIAMGIEDYEELHK